MMKLFSFLAVLVAVVSAQNGGGAPAINLPDGVELLIGGYKAGFSCEGRIYGYYADIANNCQVFHVCVPVVDEAGTGETIHYSFGCGNQTAFNQEFLTCDHAINFDCSTSEAFYAKNEDFGKIPPKA